MYVSIYLGNVVYKQGNMIKYVHTNHMQEHFKTDHGVTYGILYPYIIILHHAEVLGLIPKLTISTVLIQYVITIA